MKPVIIAKITDGLGNQLFQYATARALALRLNRKLILDISSYSNDSFGRVFLLDQFNTIYDEVLKKSYTGKKFFGIFEKYFDIYEEPKIYSNSKEQAEQFKVGNPVFDINNQLFENTSKKDILLSGYWQSEVYFKDCESKLRKELTLKKVFQNSLLVSEEKHDKDVGIGIRRYSEYLGVPDHYLLTQEYYEKALNILAKQYNNIQLKIFCVDEDRHWVEDNVIFKDYNCSFAQDYKSNLETYKVLFDYSLCGHYIISNSTFHWWGAWLGQSKNKMTIAPSKGWNCSSSESSWITKI